jgi:hypothetical protein
MYLMGLTGSYRGETKRLLSGTVVDKEEDHRTKGNENRKKRKRWAHIKDQKKEKGEI